MDGYINPEEMHVVVKLFLPPKVQKDDEYIRDIISQMDLDNDGMINYEEFVEIVKAIGAPIYMRFIHQLYKDEGQLTPMRILFCVNT